MIESVAVEKENTLVKEKKKELDFETFKLRYDDIENIQEKMHFCLEFMRDCLASANDQISKEFWQARRLCLDLFKQSISAQDRLHWWTELAEVMKEGQWLQEMQHEQSAFALEQIVIAIGDLRKQVENLEELHHPVAALEEMDGLQDLLTDVDTYKRQQSQLNVLNDFAVRINALRKELVQLSCRFSLKNKYLKELSAVGDYIFPPRRELIKEISQSFLNDVEQFKASFSAKNYPPQVVFYQVKETIKHLQLLAKVFTLNSKSFMTTRKILSECWDEVRKWEKEHKSKQSVDKELYKKNREKAESFLKPIQEKIKDGNHSELEKEIKHAEAEIAKLELGRYELRLIKQIWYEIQTAVKQREEGRKNQIKEEKRHREKQKEQAYQAAVKKIEALEENIPQESASLQEWEKNFQAYRKEIAHSDFSKMEKDKLEGQCRRLQHLIDRQKDKYLLSDDLVPDQVTVVQLKELLEDKMALKKKVKEQLEFYRQSRSTSGFDFDKVIMYDQLEKEEKIRLKQIETSIEELMQKIEHGI